MKAVIGTAFDLTPVPVGASIACAGCCLTVTEKGAGWFSVDISGETLSKTTLGQWQTGSSVNLELSLRLGDEIGGHLVSGHIDGRATVEDIGSDGESHRLRFRVPEALSMFMAPKGSVAVDGVSLTVNEVHGPVFGVNIIPFTWEHTTFRFLRPGQPVNLEVDILARYAARILGKEA